MFRGTGKLETCRACRKTNSVRGGDLGDDRVGRHPRWGSAWTRGALAQTRAHCGGQHLPMNLVQRLSCRLSHSAGLSTHHFFGYWPVSATIASESGFSRYQASVLPATYSCSSSNAVPSTQAYPVWIGVAVFRLGPLPITTGRAWSDGLTPRPVVAVDKRPLATYARLTGGAA